MEALDEHSTILPYYLALYRTVIWGSFHESRMLVGLRVPCLIPDNQELGTTPKEDSGKLFPVFLIKGLFASTEREQQSCCHINLY